MTSTFPTSPTISISLTILPITTTSTTSKYMKSTHSPIPSPVPSNNTDIDNAINNNGGSKKGMSGGAVVGLVFGILALLVCSVVGGFMLLKLRRRKRMMLAGREGHNGYRDTSSSSKEYGNNGSEDDEDGEKSRGAFAGLLPGFISKARKTASGGSLARTNVAIQQQQQQQLLQPRPMSPGFAFGSDRAVSPSSPEPVATVAALPRMLEGRAPGMIPTYGSASSFQTHQSGVLPLTGPPPCSPTSPHNTQQLMHVSGFMGPGFANQQQLPLYQQQTLQQPPQPLQQPLQGTLAQSITAPASQPYYYQPGTGLVSVPLILPLIQPQQPLVQQQQQQQPVHPLPVQQQQQQQVHQQQQVPVQYAYQSVPGASVKPSYHHPVPPVSVAIASPYAMHQTQLLLQQQPVPFFPPPAAVVPPQTTSTELTSAQARTATPEPNCIFLPGDISRPLLGQGLFKIVPDAEDEEEARRGASATGRIINGSSSGGAADSRLPLDLDLNFGGDLLNSVITYENQDERFRALEAKQVGDQRQKKGLSQSFQQLQLAPRNASQEVVIVGSDIVLEPLPSAKAAAKASATASHDPRVTTSETNKEVGSTTTTLQSQGEDRHDNQQSNNSNNGKGAIKPRLTRHPTIGAILPTMGTEEYLERTHDKEEYSYGVHGDRRSNAGSIMDLSMTSVVVHPPTRTELCQAAQGDILGTVAVEIPSPVGISAADQDAITSPSLVATSLPPTAATAAVVPPPLARATKPKLK